MAFIFISLSISHHFIKFAANIIMRHASIALLCANSQLFMEQNHTYNIGPAIKHLRTVDRRLACVIDAIGIIDINYYKEADGFNFLVREIIGQMISAKAKKTIYERFLSLCGYPVLPSKIISLTQEQIRETGISSSKAKYIINLALQVKNGAINLEGLSSQSDKEVSSILMSIQGIGKWTSKMYLLFYLHREDVLPVEDVAFLQAYKWLYSTDNVSPLGVLNKCKIWSPYMSIGARYMYKALDSGLTKINIDSFLQTSPNLYGEL